MDFGTGKGSSKLSMDPIGLINVDVSTREVVFAPIGSGRGCKPTQYLPRPCGPEKSPKGRLQGADPSRQSSLRGDRRHPSGKVPSRLIGCARPCDHRGTAAIGAFYCCHGWRTGCSSGHHHHGGIGTRTKLPGRRLRKGGPRTRLTARRPKLPWHFGARLRCSMPASPPACREKATWR